MRGDKSRTSLHPPVDNWNDNKADHNTREREGREPVLLLLLKEAKNQLRAVLL